MSPSWTNRLQVRDLGLSEPCQSYDSGLAETMLVLSPRVTEAKIWASCMPVSSRTSWSKPIPTSFFPENPGKPLCSEELGSLSMMETLAALLENPGEFSPYPAASDYH